MQASQVIQRQSIIDEACRVADLTTGELLKYAPSEILNTSDPELAAALQVLDGHGFADEVFSSDGYKSYWYRIDRWIMDCDDAGFYNLHEHATEQQAVEVARLRVAEETTEASEHEVH